MRLVLLVLFLAGMLCACTCHAQFREGSSIFYTKDGSKVIGRVVKEQSALYKVEAFNDTITLLKRDIDYRYKADRIGVIYDGRFHVVSGFNVSASYGGAVNENGGSVLFDLSVNKKLNSKLSLGASILLLEDAFEIPVFNGVQVQNRFITARSSSICLGGEYFFSDHFIAPANFRMYGHLNLGTAFVTGSGASREDFQNAVFIAQYGIGLQWANKKTRKYFVQLSQINQKIDGRATSFFWGEPPASVEYNLWNNSFLFSFGCEFNINLKSK